MKSGNHYDILESRDLINEWTDEQLIYDTFKDHETSTVRVYAIDKLTNQDLIFSFKDDPEGVVRGAVVQNLSDENLIYETFKDDSDPYVRYRVVENLTDVDLLSTFQDDKFYDVRKAATNKVSAHYQVEVINQISDEKLLVNAFKSDFSEDVRQAVVDKVTDEKLLFDGFGKDPSADIRQKVVEKLTDAEMLSTFQDDKIEDVREAAAKKLSEFDNEFSDALNQLPTDQGLEL